MSIELALAADVVVAASDACSRQLEVGRGIMPFGGATLRALLLPGVLPSKDAAEGLHSFIERRPARFEGS